MKLIRQWEIIELVLDQNARPTSFKALPRAQKWEFQQNEKPPPPGKYHKLPKNTKIGTYTP